MKIKYELLNGEEVIACNDYHEAKEYADKHNLILAEYGDIYGTKEAYAYWNKSGNRYDDEAIIAYYLWNENGKPQTMPEEQFKRRVFN